MPAVKSAHHKIMIDGLSDFWHLSIPITQVLYPFLIGKLLVKQKKPTQCLYKEELYINVLPWRVANYVTLTVQIHTQNLTPKTSEEFPVMVKLEGE